MITCNAYPAELKVFLNHVYEYKKGVRNMVLYTTNKKYEEFAVSRLNSQNIDYCIQPIGCNKINLFFGRRECIEVIQSMTSRPLNELTQRRISYWEPCWVTIFADNVSAIASAKPNEIIIKSPKSQI